MPAKKGQRPWNKGLKRPKPKIEEKRKVTAETRKKVGIVKPAGLLPIVDYPSVGDEVNKYGPRNLEFEQKLGVPPAEVSPKQGAPLPMRAEDQETIEGTTLKMLANSLKLPFAFWASRAGLPALRLTDQEAREWAEPTKALLDHYMPKIPEMVYAWIAWSVCTCSIMDKRFVLITAEREKRSARQSSESQGTVGPSSRQANTGPIAQGAPKYEPKRV